MENEEDPTKSEPRLKCPRCNSTDSARMSLVSQNVSNYYKMYATKGKIIVVSMPEEVEDDDYSLKIACFACGEYFPVPEEMEIDW